MASYELTLDRDIDNRLHGLAGEGGRTFTEVIQRAISLYLYVHEVVVGDDRLAIIGSHDEVKKVFNPLV